MIKRLLALALFLAACGCFSSTGWAREGKPVMYLPVSLIPDNNILKVSWEAQEGVTEYTVERWELKGTNHWHYDINEKMRPEDKRLKIGGAELDPLVFAHRVDPGGAPEYYDQGVRPGYTYFYRVNGGIIGVGETKNRPVAALDVGGVKIDPGVNTGADPGGTGTGGVNSGRNERQKKYDSLADYPERMAADLIMALPNWLIGVIGLYDPLELVFEIKLKDSFGLDDRPPEASADRMWNIYSKEEFRVIDDFYTNTRQAIPVFMAVGVVVAGVMIVFGSTSPGSLLTTRGYILGILLSALLIRLAPYLIGFLFDVNRAIVALCHSVVAGEIDQSFLHSIYNEDTRSLGAALIAFIGCLSLGVINFQFAVRKLFIAILVGVLPLVLVNAIFPGRRNVLSLWFREFTSYVFMPSGLAVGLSFFIHFINMGDFWVTLVCLLFLPAINGLVRGVLGLSDGGLASGVGSALGMGALFSMGGLLGSVADGKSSAGQGLSGAAAPGGGPPGSPGSPGSAGKAGGGQAVPGGGLYAGLGKGAPGIARSLAGGALRGAVSVGVKGSAALAGGVASGALSGDPGQGLKYGINIGGRAVAAVNDAGRNLRGFVSEVRGKGFEDATGIVDRSMFLDPGVTASLATRALGRNAIGSAAASAAASASRAARAASPLIAPEARERLDQVSALARAGPDLEGTGSSAPGQNFNLKNEFQKAHQARQFRIMFEKIKTLGSAGGSGGVDGFHWR